MWIPFAKNVVVIKEASDNNFNFYGNNEGFWTKLINFIIGLFLCNSQQGPKKNEKNNEHNEVDRIFAILHTSYDDGDFLRHAQEYSDIYKSKQDNDIYYLAASLEAYMYYRYASIDDDYDYLELALNCVYSIQKRLNYDIQSKFYFFVTSIECCCYSDVYANVSLKRQSTQNKTKTERWSLAITELEKYMSTFDVKNLDYYDRLSLDLAHDGISRYFLGLVLGDICLSNLDNINVDVSVSTRFIEFEQKYQKIKAWPNLVPDSETYFSIWNAYLAELMSIISILLEITSDETSYYHAVKKIDNIINKCCVVLYENNGLFSSNDVVCAMFNSIIANALFYKKLIYQILGNFDGMKACDNENRKILSALLRWPNASGTIVTFFSSMTIIIIFCTICKDKDMVYYYENEQKLLNNDIYKKMPNIHKKAMIFTMCRACKNILEQCGYDEQIYELGLKHVNELNTYMAINKDYSWEKMIEELHNYFTEYEVPKEFMSK